MAVVNDSVSANYFWASAATSITVASGNINPSANANALLAVLILNGTPTSPSVHWGSQAMTLVTGVAGTGVWIGFFSLLNPTLSTQTLSATWTGSLSGSLSGLTLTGCGGFVASNSNVTGTSHTLAVTGTPGNLNVVAAAAAAGNTISGGPFTNYSTVSVYSDTSAGFPSSTARGRSQPSLTWTTNTAASVACLMVGIECTASVGGAQPHEFYFLNTTPVTPFFWGVMQDGGSPPAGMTRGNAGWTVGTTVAYWRARVGASAAATVSQGTTFIGATTAPTPGTGSSNTTASDSFVTHQPYSGTINAGVWFFQIALGPTTATSTGCIRFRIWASTQYSGAGARELTSGAQAGLINTMNSSGSYWDSWAQFSLGAITLNNEYLFFQLEFQSTTAGTVSGANAFFFAGVDQYVLTPPMTAAPVTPVGAAALMVGI